MKRVAALILFACLTAKAHAAPFAPFVVSDIRIDGLERISAGTVFTYLPVEKGDTLTESEVQKAIRALFQTGFFKDIEFDRQGSILVIKVKERPAVAKITIHGNKDVKTDELLKGLKSIGLAEGETFDRMALDQVQQELIHTYYNRGKYNVSIKPHVIQLNRNRVSVDIEVHEGKAAKIRQINIVGNTTFPDDVLRQGFQSDSTNWTSWYSSNDQYSRDKLSGDLENLASFYLDRGYADFNIKSTEVSISPDKRNMYITAGVHEGDVYTIADVKLLGDLAIPDKILRAVLAVRKGQRFSQRRMEVTKETIVALLSNIGYAFAQVRDIPELNKEKHTVDVTFYVQPGPRVYVRRINFSGNARTEDHVLRREFRQFEGSWYSQAAVDRSKTRLERLGYFKTVEITKTPVPGTKDQVDLDVKVEEQSAGSLLFGLGYSQLSGIIGSFSVSQNNFFGSGDSFTAAIQRSSFMQQYSLQYMDPYLTDSGVSIGYNLQYSKLDEGDANIADFLYSVRSFSTLLGIPISENRSIGVGLGISSNTITAFPGATPQPLIDYVNELGHRTNHSWTATASWGEDTRNRYFLPTRGGSQRLSAKVALPGSTVQFYKLFYDIGHYWTLPKDFVLYLSGSTAYGDTYGSSKELAFPFWENFYAGGVNDVRGFQDNTLGPRVSTPFYRYPKPIGGAFKVLGKAELYFPIPALRNSTTARLGAFVDIGNVFADIPSFRAKDLRASAGLALQWRAPIGPLTISLAEPLHYKKSDRPYLERIQFTFGSTF
ncbi:MAG TPA: outer membrane protein assembly factor BamA [Rhodanobacteraceae bacterium]|nr:outer membrane protein assembly factor BamA [Rhodanobacteraceae bacterium]